MVELVGGVLYCVAISGSAYGLTKLFNWMKL